MLDELASALSDASTDVLAAGPAGSVGAVARRRLGVGGRAVAPRLEGPAMVVCGSATAAAHEQLAHLASVHREVEIIAATPTAGALEPDVAREVVDRARARLCQQRFCTVVVIGGTTAALLLGDAPRLVGGTVLPGLPWSRDQHGGGPLVVSKAGAFGHAHTLVELFSPSRGEESFT
jgi:uncharacterized protein YgbK (DUF1537 family)